MKECNNTPWDSSLNSYLWLFKHYNQYQLVQKIIKDLKFDNLKKISKMVKYYCQK